MARSLCVLNLPLELHSSVARCQRATTHPTDRLLRLQTFLQACRAKARTRHTENRVMHRGDKTTGMDRFKKTSMNNGLKTICSLILIQILSPPTPEKWGGGEREQTLQRTHRSNNRNKCKLPWYTVKGVMAQSSNLSPQHWGILVGFPQWTSVFPVNGESGTHTSEHWNHEIRIVDP